MGNTNSYPSFLIFHFCEASSASSPPPPMLRLPTPPGRSQKRSSEGRVSDLALPKAGTLPINSTLGSCKVDTLSEQTQRAENALRWPLNGVHFPLFLPPRSQFSIRASLHPYVEKSFTIMIIDSKPQHPTHPSTPQRSNTIYLSIFLSIDNQ